MASTPSMLTDSHAELAIDASVLINLLGSGEPQAVLKSLGRPVLVANPVYEEIKTDPYTRQSAQGILNDLEGNGLITRCALGPAAIKHMIELVAAPNRDSLDDGEAATIALGAQRGCCIVIDEKRGRRIAQQIAPAIPMLGSLDILAAPSVVKALGVKRHRIAISNAARLARMRFPIDWGGWTENLLGESEARSLPGMTAFYRQYDACAKRA